MAATLTGGCHCGMVRFKVTTSANTVVVCNCSICRKKGARHLRVSPNDFELLSGENQLRIYQFGTGVAKHPFCQNCGIHPFNSPRSAPDMINVNIQCLDNLDEVEQGFNYIQFDGQHWEQAVAALRKSLD